MNLMDALAAKLAASATVRGTRPSLVAGLPVPRPPERVRRTSTRYAFTTMDHRGRLGDRSLIRMLGWPPGTSLRPTVLDGHIIVLSCASGTALVTKLGHVRIPVGIRHRCQLRAGNGLLLAASPSQAVLILCTTSVLDQALATFVSGEPS